MIITESSFLFLPSLLMFFGHRSLPTIIPSRPSPLVRAGKIAIRVCSITLHCQKYYLPRWRGEFERVMLSLTSPPWPMPKVRATGHRSEGTCSLFSFRRDTDSPANTVASYPLTRYAPSIKKAKRPFFVSSRNAPPQKRLLSMTRLWRGALCDDSRTAVKQTKSHNQQIVSSKLKRPFPTDLSMSWLLHFFAFERTVNV